MPTSIDASTIRRTVRAPARWPAAVGKPAPLRPAAVAVEDDRDRLRDLGQRRLGRLAGARERADAGEKLHERSV